VADARRAADRADPDPRRAEILLGVGMSVRIIVGSRSERGQFIPGIHAYREPRLHWDRAWLVQRYIIEYRSAAAIAKEIGCGESNVDYWLAKHCIRRWTVSEVRARKHWGNAGSANPMFGKVGPLNPRYVDGSSPERQAMYARGVGREFLREVLKRDGYRCVRCGAKKTGPKSLHVHHIKPWAGNVSLRFDPDNAVTLCRDCHVWVHSRRNRRKEFLK
jgi:hypothetical protein